MEALFSRKFMVAIATAVTIALQEKFGLSLDPEALVSLGVVAIAYITGQAQVDKAKVAAELDAQKLLLNQHVVNLTKELNYLRAEPSE